MVELNEKALKTARDAYITANSRGVGVEFEVGALEDAIIAYLSVIPAPDDGLIGKLLEAADDWRRLSDPENEELTLAAATDLRSKDEQIKRLKYERDVWHSKSQMHQKAAVGLTIAEQQVQKLTAENERLREAAKESSRLLKDLDLGRSIHNSRFPQQNIDGPLWAQIPRICEIARSALEIQEGGE